MRALLPKERPAPIPLEKAVEGVSRTDVALVPFHTLAKASVSVFGNSIGEVKVGRRRHQMPRFVFLGPKGGGDTIRLGLFAAFRGDETEGPAILARLLEALEAHPEIATGFHIYAYPICNPGAFAEGIRMREDETDLTRQFWNRSSRAEAYFLEREMGVQGFQGVISLHRSSASRLEYSLRACLRNHF